MDINKLSVNARKNYEALMKLDIANMVAQGREAAAKENWDLAASFVAALAYPALSVYEAQRKIAWGYAKNHLKYGQCFDDVCHSTIKLKAIHEYVSKFINPPTWLKYNNKEKS